MLLPHIQYLDLLRLSYILLYVSRVLMGKVASEVASRFAEKTPDDPESRGLSVMQSDFDPDRWGRCEN